MVKWSGGVMVMLKNGSTTRRRERERTIKNLIDYEDDDEDEEDFDTPRADTQNAPALLSVTDHAF
ncbi:MAG TPA: hypothetical protein VNZ64_17305 [Candidatus Acidoferrum sp.]|jgi:hypothetical protein|nr:hypothetical protein [Candidatus Acidoferrum sp.]